MIYFNVNTCAIIAITIISVYLVVYSAIEQRHSGEKGKWYYYVPVSVLNGAFGTIAPYAFVYILFSFDDKDSRLSAILILVGYILLFLGNNIGFFLAFFRKKGFSVKLYMLCTLLSLFVISYWSLRLLTLF